MLKKLLLVFVGILAYTSVTFAQSGTLKGVVTDAATGESLPVVNVFITELTKGDVTSIDGEYSITGITYGTYNVTVTFIGFKTLEMEVQINKPVTTIDFELEEDLMLLDDVVVTAMGIETSKAAVGTSVQNVSGESLTQVSESNIAEALGGKISGVQIIGSSGAALGGSAKIRIRGASGLTETPPLIVIDGTPIENDNYSAGSTSGIDYGSGLADINPNDVEKMTVLKGATASALYGQRAAGGVILITTKKGSFSQTKKIGITYNHSSSFENVSLLPSYQNEYAGGGSQDFIKITPEGSTLYENGGSYYLGYDSETDTYSNQYSGTVQNRLNYAVDESWGPKMEGQEYRPWWSWYPTEEEYGQTTTLTAQPDNVKDFFDTGITMYNNLALDFGNEKGAYRLGVSNNHQTGVMPNSEIDKTTVSFNGSLNLTEKIQSTINFNYSNTDAKERPDYGYNGDNPMTSFNQWFQRQLDIDRLEDFVAEDGSFKSWNITSPTNLTPLYWDSPYFSVYENVPTDNREHLFGNVSLRYSINDNVGVKATMRRDSYTHFMEDKIGTGGISTDWYSIRRRTGTEDNYELLVDYNYGFDKVSVTGILGTNYQNSVFNSLYEGTNGGLSLPNYYDIAASIDRPSVDSYRSKEQVASFFGTANVGYDDKVYFDFSLRNDKASTLPTDNNSYWYGSATTSIIMTEILPQLSDNGVLSFWKLRAGYGQVGNSAPVYSVYNTYSISTSYGSNPIMTLPNTKANEDLRPAISDEYEIGTELSFFNGRLSTDINYYYASKKDEILAVDVSGATGYESVYVNAGEFLKKGLEVSLSGRPIVSKDFSLSTTVNWSTNYSEVVSLYPNITSLNIDTYLYAREGEEWGVISTYGYTRDVAGNKIISSTGLPTYENGIDLGHLLPDWQGGFSLDADYKNFSLHTFFEFQKGGLFYSVTKRYNAYSGMGSQTVGNNALGNPLRDPVLDSTGDEVSYVLAANAAANSGGVLVEGVDDEGNAVAYYTEASRYFKRLASIREEWVYDASYLKLRDVRLTYRLPASVLSKLSAQSADISLTVKNAWLIWTSVDGLDPSEVSNGNYGFSVYEGGQLPGVRSIGMSLNLKF